MKIRMLCTLALLLVTQLAQAEPGADSAASTGAFEAGSRAYKAGDYATALEYFDKAWAAGNNSATLQYNRAVTLYKLDQLGQAKQAFSNLLLNTRWVHLARYNLGRIAEQERDPAAAIVWYRDVRDYADNEKLRRLAVQRLAALEAPAPVQPADNTPRRAAALVSLGLAWDSNASSLADDLARNASDTADSFINALAYGHYYVSGNKGAGMRVYGLAHSRHFQTYDAFDATVFGLGAARELAFGDFSAEAGVRFIRASVDAGHLANQYTALAKLGRPVAAGDLELKYHSTWFDAGESFAHIKGWQHQLQLDWRRSHGRFAFTPGLRWQTNRREDRETPTHFYSYSPTIVAALLDVKWQLSDAWALAGGLEMSRATYSGENRLTDVGGLDRTQQRENTRLAFEAGVRYSLSSRWRVKADYSYARADDEYAIYSYDKQVVGVKLEYGF